MHLIESFANEMNLYLEREGERERGRETVQLLHSLIERSVLLSGVNLIKTLIKQRGL